LVIELKREPPYSANILDQGRLPELLSTYRSEPFDLISFTKRARELGFTSSRDLVRESVKEENLLGTGKNARAFKIPGIQTYAVRIPTRLSRLSPNGDIQEYPDPLPNINIGQPVARVASGYLVKFVPGISSTSLAYGLQAAPTSQSTHSSWYNALNEVRADALRDLCKIVNIANQAGLKLDIHNPGNVLLDQARGVLTPIDLRPVSSNGADPREFRNTGLEVAEMLLQVPDIDPYLDNPVNRDLLIPLINRVLDSAKEAGLRVGDGSARQALKICNTLGVINQ